MGLRHPVIKQLGVLYFYDIVFFSLQSVDTLNEAIKLERFDTMSVNQLRHCIPKRAARYHFFKYNHQYEGDYFESVIFLYSMPSSGCSIKDRMLYSSCKGPFLDYVEQVVGLTIARKVSKYIGCGARFRGSKRMGT